MKLMNHLQESGVGNREPLEDILKEKGLYFNYDQSQVADKLREMGKEDLIGKVGAIISMIDPVEGESSIWFMESKEPGLKDWAKRVK